MIDCAVRVPSGTPNTMAQHFADEVVKIHDAHEALVSVEAKLIETMSGQTVMAIRNTLDTHIQVVDNLASSLVLLVAALRGLAEDLTLVESGLYEVLISAGHGGLHVAGGVIHSPAPSVPDHAEKMAIFEALSQTVEQLRVEEDEAHAEFQEICKDAHMLPPNAIDASQELRTELAAAHHGGVVAGWATAMTPGTSFISPRTAARRANMRGLIERGAAPSEVHALVEGAKAERVAHRATLTGRGILTIRGLAEERNFANRVAVGGEASTAGRALRAGRGVLRAASFVGGILTAATIVERGYAQARDDSINPDLSPAERAARIATHGAFEGLAQSIGEAAGAAAGAAVGVHGGPVAIGAGFVAGGEIGAERGTHYGEVTSDWFDRRIWRPTLHGTD